MLQEQHNQLFCSSMSDKTDPSKELLPVELHCLKTLAETSGALVPTDVFINGQRRTGICVAHLNGKIELVGFLRHPNDKIETPTPPDSPPDTTLPN